MYEETGNSKVPGSWKSSAGHSMGLEEHLVKHSSRYTRK